jgi:hypothetical protein
MADNIVGGLFGIDPSQIQQQRMAQDFKEGYMLAQLSPMERATAGVYAGSKQLSRAAQGLLGMEDPQLQEAAMAKKLAENYNINSVEGLNQLSSALLAAGSPRYSQLAKQQAMDLEKQGLGLRKERAAVEKSEMSAAQEEQLRQELASLGPNPTEQQVIAVVQKYGSPDKILQILTASQDRQAARAAKASGGGGIGPLTPAEKVVDQKFGKEYNDFVNGGGINTVEKNLKMLDDAIKLIKDSPDGDTTGKMVGLADKAGTLSYTHPKAAEAKDLIGGVAQSNLRQVLGGQFAAKEGEQLLARAYNPAQPKKDNLNRLNALREQIANTAEAKSNAAMYYQDNGTLKGFKGVGAAVDKPATETKEKKTRTLKSGKVVTIED